MLPRTTQSSSRRLGGPRRRVFHIPSDILLNNHLPTTAAPYTARILMYDIDFISHLEILPIMSTSVPRTQLGSTTFIRSDFAIRRHDIAAILVGLVPPGEILERFESAGVGVATAGTIHTG